MDTNTFTGRLGLAFRHDERGAVAVIFGLLLIPLVLFLGLGLDSARLEHRRASNQQALDGASVSVVSALGARATSAELQKYYANNGGTGTVAIISVTDQQTVVKVQAKADAQVPMLFGKFTGGRSEGVLSVTSEVQAPKRLTELKIDPLRAQGWYIKTMTLYAKISGDPVPRVLGSVHYQPDTPTSLTGTMTDTFGGGWVSVRNAEEVWFEMVIDPSSEGILPGLKMRMQTNDPETSNYLFVDGTQLPTGRKVNLAEIVPCGKTSEHQWEDGGDFKDQDFFYNVTGNCEVSAGGVAYLSK